MLVLDSTGSIGSALKGSTPINFYRGVLLAKIQLLINKYKQIFLKLDKNRRGYVTFEQLHALLKDEFSEE